MRKARALAPMALIAGCLVLAAYIASHLGDAAGPRNGARIWPIVDAAVVPKNVAPDTAEPSFLPPISEFSATTERPVFMVTRRLPVSSQVDDTQLAQQPFSALLRGIVYSSGARLAVVAPKAGSRALRLSEHSKYQGWTVVEIAPKAVVFRRGDSEKRLELNNKSRKPVLVRAAASGSVTSNSVRQVGPTKPLSAAPRASSDIGDQDRTSQALPNQ